MKKIAPLLSACCVFGLIAATCNNNTSRNDRSQKADTISQDAAYARIIATINELDSVQRLKNASCNPNFPCLQENIWQYIFRTQDISISSGDSWRLHKAYDQTIDSVCIVLEVLHASGTVPAYYRVMADCPRICGITKGGLEPETAKHYLQNPVISLDRSQAESLMQNPQNGLVQCVTIDWNQGIGKAKNAALFQVVQTYHAGAVSGVLVFNIDASGQAAGGVISLPVIQECIASPTNACGLLP